MSNDHYAPSLDALPLFRMARRTDPRTSHEAARRVPAGEHRRAILAALDAGPAGQTEIAGRTGLTVAQVSKRLCELRRDGTIERTGRTVAGGESEYRTASR
jgi:predicted Rossmann fold nucleotide-binding protein DprA/Smf involved in DNA uptake